MEYYERGESRLGDEVARLVDEIRAWVDKVLGLVQR